MGPTPKQVVGIVMILGSAVVAMPLESTGPLLVCGMASMFGLLLLLKGGQRGTEQRTFCYCKNCRNELCADPRTTFTDVDGVVTYKCGECGKFQRFLFDAPVPIYLGEVKP